MEQSNSKEERKGPGVATPKGGSRARLRDFSRSLPMSLLKAREAVMRHFRPHLQAYGITEQQWRVLRALMSVESIEVMALAEATFLLPPSLSRILKDLEERGLIHRRTSEQDMRRGIISISGEGRRVIEMAGSHSEAVYAEITRRYGAQKLADLQKMLRELEAVLAEPIEVGALPKPAERKAPSD
ncbi:homoprotocatechuate degradation operon regulator HpaR [Nitratireductor thuwali]|uniref:Organic hydroperoxide resistance transcriptional regulator n=1 Tax=Nitratireductor thuwali TaxID=2267699 RepID=A0ABY5MG71_9HYPH|nr:Organic hydroperoxide resistance transcriptional regulator [Nitratireductor thuwali]